MPDPSPTAVPLLTVGLPSFGDMAAGDGPRQLLDLAVAAETAGIDGVVVPEHVVMGARPEAYPWGSFPVPPDAPWLDALTVLTAVGARTERLRLQTGVLVAAARPAPVLAKQAATIDVLTVGRLDLGVGTGWQREELEACGVPYDERGQRLTDTMGACRALWAGGPTSFSSPSITVDDLWCHPVPTTPGGPPVLFSGTLTARNVDRITRLGDGWIPIMGTTGEQLADDVIRLRAAWAAAGRPSDALRVRGALPTRPGPDGRPDVLATLEGAPALIAAGATELTLTLRTFVADIDAAPAWLTDLGRRWTSSR